MFLLCRGRMLIDLLDCSLCITLIFKDHCDLLRLPFHYQMKSVGLDWQRLQISHISATLIGVFFSLDGNRSPFPLFRLITCLMDMDLLDILHHCPINRLLAPLDLTQVTQDIECQMVHGMKPAMIVLQTPTKDLVMLQMKSLIILKMLSVSRIPLCLIQLPNLNSGKESKCTD